MESDPIPVMEVTITVERLPVVAEESWHRLKVATPRSRFMQASRLARGLYPEMVSLAPSYYDKFRRKQAKKEILRRALTPPVRRPTLRWLDFRPTPSRLRNMSVE